MLLALSSNQKLGLALAAAAFVVFALVCAMVIPRSRPNFPEGHLSWFIAACVLFTVGMLLTIGFVAKESEEEIAGHETPATETAETTDTGTTETTETTQTEPTETMASGAVRGGQALGEAVFATNCGSCHTLSAAGTSGTVGPNLDQSKPAEALVLDRVRNGQGIMPAFEGTLSEEEITEVAKYVSSVAGS